ncbi:MAG: alkane 1-monooxygenase [Lewinella sp.]|nr:alkane 1-monooxygenase [Lewinella sp.]
MTSLYWRDAKYLLAYLAPLAGFLGLYLGGYWSAGSIYIGFVAIPLLELVLPQSTANHRPEEEATRSGLRFFDWLLYLNLPILWGLVIYYFHVLSTRDLSTGETVWMTLNVGLVIGILGINVAHELGHRSRRYEQLMAQAMLCSALYMHFFIEHNRGHHKHVATPADPASAVRGQTIYAFWWQSVTGSYRNAWRLERKRLDKAGQPVQSRANLMVRFTVIQLVYLLLVGWIWGPAMVPFAIAIAVVGFLLLESVNYIEHYGLRRQPLPSGRYEPVGPQHSWNSDHELGRIFLYELTRHSDHHYRASRKYQILRHFDESPQLPTGYPGAILTALVPPVWFAVMDQRVTPAPAGASAG